MANYSCRNGHTWTGRSNLSRRFTPAELRCPQPDCGLPAEPKMKQGGGYSDLPEEELLKILFDPRIAAPLCRGGHENVKSLRIYWDEVSADCKEACQEVDEGWLDVLTPSGVRRKSMYAELRRVCPVREVARV